MQSRVLLLLRLFVVLAVFFCAHQADGAARIEIPLPDGGSLPAYWFGPRHGVVRPLPAVIVAAGVGATKIAQYHEHCQLLADRNFMVLFIDPSNYPESLAPGPLEWDKGWGWIKGSFNQGIVAARLKFSQKWCMDSIKASVNFLSCNPWVDRSRIVLSGFSQPANMALAYACQDPRIRCVVWNYGGWPWVFPYDPLKLPPVLIFHGEADEVYDVKYARELAEELQTHARPHEAHIYPGQKHMFNVYYDLKKENRFMKPALLDAFERMVAFLNRALNGRAVGL